MTQISDGQRDFFAHFPDILAQHFGSTGEQDQSIDLEEFCSNPKPEIALRKNDNCMNVHDKANLEELQFLYQTISKNNTYSRKLIGIMLDQLKKKDSFMYERFINNKLDKTTWIPIVNMNSSNTPYIEFLFKADESDISPFEQLKHYTPDHLGYASSIINVIRTTLVSNKSNKQQSKLLVRSAYHHSTPKKQQVQKKTINTVPRPAARPTVVPTSPSENSSAHDTSIKRIMPPRRCKSAISSSYTL